jgi:hypothetical protein
VSRARVRRAPVGSQSLDSLLDTMANVVGILIVLLAVTQMTVGAAMDRIRIFDSDESQALSAQRDTLEQALEALGPLDGSTLTALETLKRQLSAVRADPDAFRLRDDPVATSTAAAASAAAVRRLAREVDEKRSRLVSLQVQAKALEENNPDGPIELRLPDPRPAPPRADRLVLLARYGRVLEPGLAGLETQLNDAMHAWVEHTRREVRGEGAKQLASHINSLGLGNRWLRWSMDGSQGAPVAILDWRDRDEGDDLASLRTERSQLARVLRELDPERHYLQFWVWGDSFEAYLEARRVAETAGFSVGWKAIPADDPLQGRLGRQALSAAPVD